MKLRTFTALLLAAIMLFALTACGSQAADDSSSCDVTRSVSKMTEIERRGGKRWDKPKKAGKSRDCRGGKF